jgi:hypothetical protein
MIVRRGGQNELLSEMKNKSAGPHTKTAQICLEYSTMSLPARVKSDQIAEETKEIQADRTSCHLSSTFQEETMI